MIIEEIQGNIHSVNDKAPHIERVFMKSDDLLKRVLRVKTDHGNEMGIRLKKKKELKDGDILYRDEKNMIIITTIKDDVLTIYPASLQEMGEIAHQIGNRHTPAQFEKNAMIIQYDYLLENLLEELGVSFKREKRQMKEAFRHIGHSHE